MKFKWTSSNLFLIKFLGSLIIIGVIVGIFIYNRESSLVKSSIISELATLKDILVNNHQNNFIYHIIILSVFSFLSLIIIGLPVILFYLFYEGISLGFLLASLYHYKKVNGLLFGLTFGIVNKSFIYLMLIYLLITSINYSKKIIISIKRKDYKIYEYIINHLIKIVAIFLIILLSDIFIYFLGNKIISYLLFLL